MSKTLTEGEKNKKSLCKYMKKAPFDTRSCGKGKEITL